MIYINQSIFNRGFPIRQALDGDWAGAQNFQSTFNNLTKCEIYIRKFGNPDFNLTIEIRETSIEGFILKKYIYSSEEISSNWSWVEFDISTINFDSEKEYFIICPSSSKKILNSFGYEWGYAFGNQYDNGTFWFTRDGGNLWRDLLSKYEFCFKIFSNSL